MQDSNHELAKRRSEEVRKHNVLNLTIESSSSNFDGTDIQSALTSIEPMVLRISSSKTDAKKYTKSCSYQMLCSVTSGRAWGSSLNGFGSCPYPSSYMLVVLPFFSFCFFVANIPHAEFSSSPLVVRT